MLTHYNYAAELRILAEENLTGDAVQEVVKPEESNEKKELPEESNEKKELPKKEISIEETKKDESDQESKNLKENSISEENKPNSEEESSESLDLEKVKTIAASVFYIATLVGTYVIFQDLNKKIDRLNSSIKSNSETSGASVTEIQRQITKLQSLLNKLETVDTATSQNTEEKKATDTAVDVDGSSIAKPEEEPEDESESPADASKDVPSIESKPEDESKLPADSPDSPSKDESKQKPAKPKAKAKAKAKKDSVQEAVDVKTETASGEAKKEETEVELKAVPHKEAKAETKEVATLDKLPLNFPSHLKALLPDSLNLFGRFGLTLADGKKYIGLEPESTATKNFPSASFYYRPQPIGLKNDQNQPEIFLPVLLVQGEKESGFDVMGLLVKLPPVIAESDLYLCIESEELEKFEEKTQTGEVYYKCSFSRGSNTIFGSDTLLANSENEEFLKQYYGFIADLLGIKSEFSKDNPALNTLISLVQFLEVVRGTILAKTHKKNSEKFELNSYKEGKELIEAVLGTMKKVLPEFFEKIVSSEKITVTGLTDARKHLHEETRLALFAKK